VSQALRVGDPERADMDSEGNDDGVKLPVSEASSDGCECCRAVLRVCCVRFLRVRGSAHPWASRSGNSDRLLGGGLCARRLAGRKTSQSALKSLSSVEVLLLSECARFAMLIAWCCVVVL
jgi:hypothetical protein